MNDEDRPHGEKSSASGYWKCWEEVRDQGQRKCELGAQLSREGAFEIDLADTFLLCRSYMVSGEALEDISVYPYRLSVAQGQQLDSLSQTWSAGTVSSTASISTVLQDLSQPQPRYFNFKETEQRDEVRGYFENLFARNDRKGKAISLMKRLDLGKTRSGQKAVNQFLAAWKEYEEFSATPTASLIPLRSSIDSTVNEVWQRRLFHTKGRVKKARRIIEIGQILGAQGTTSEDFKSLQAEWQSIGDALSSSKEGEQERWNEHQLLIRGTLFLIRFLGAIDPKKLH